MLKNVDPVLENAGLQVARALTSNQLNLTSVLTMASEVRSLKDIRGVTTHLLAGLENHRSLLNNAQAYLRDQSAQKIASSHSDAITAAIPQFYSTLNNPQASFPEFQTLLQNAQAFLPNQLAAEQLVLLPAFMTTVNVGPPIGALSGSTGLARDLHQVDVQHRKKHRRHHHHHERMVQPVLGSQGGIPPNLPLIEVDQDGFLIPVSTPAPNLMGTWTGQSQIRSHRRHHHHHQEIMEQRRLAIENFATARTLRNQGLLSQAPPPQYYVLDSSNKGVEQVVYLPSSQQKLEPQSYFVPRDEQVTPLPEGVIPAESVVYVQ